MVIGAFIITFLVVSLSPTSLFLTLIVVVIIWVVVKSFRNRSAASLRRNVEAKNCSAHACS